MRCGVSHSVPCLRSLHNTFFFFQTSSYRWTEMERVEEGSGALVDGVSSTGDGGLASMTAATAAAAAAAGGGVGSPLLFAPPAAGADGGMAACGTAARLTSAS